MGFNFSIRRTLIIAILSLFYLTSISQVPGAVGPAPSTTTFTGFGAWQAVQFTASGSYILQNGLEGSTFYVNVWGGGSAGGGATGNPAGGGGGSGGNYSGGVFVFVDVAGTSKTVTVGAQVTGGTGAGPNGNESFYNNSSYCRAAGGFGGSLASTNSSSAAGGTASGTGDFWTVPYHYIGGDGGTGSAGTSAGGGGEGAGTTATGGAGGVTTGGTGTNGGDGGAGGTTGGTGGVGATGTATGGGGGGGRAGNNTDRAGGNGARGEVWIIVRTTHLGFM